MGLTGGGGAFEIASGPLLKGSAPETRRDLGEDPEGPAQADGRLLNARGGQARPAAGGGEARARGLCDGRDGDNQDVPPLWHVVDGGISPAMRSWVCPSGLTVHIRDESPCPNGLGRLFGLLGGDGLLGNPACDARARRGRPRASHAGSPKNRRKRWANFCPRRNGPGRGRRGTEETQGPATQPRSQTPVNLLFLWHVLYVCDER